MPVTLTLRRLGYRIAYRVLQVFWFVDAPPKQGVKCLLTCHDRVLLVRHTYGSRAWDVPGGAIKRGEPPLTAARREMGEELGLTTSSGSRSARSAATSITGATRSTAFAPRCASRR